MDISNNSKEISLLENNYNIIINSYNNLKIILEPNLIDEKKRIISYLLETFISQLKFFKDLISINDFENKYELLNLNNQKLSKSICGLFLLIDEYNKKENLSSKNLLIQSINKLNIKSKIKKSNLSNKKNSLIPHKNGYDKDDESRNTNNDKQSRYNYCLIKNNSNFLRPINKDKNNSTQYKKCSKKPNINVNNLNKSYNKKNSSYNLNINIYSNDSDNNLRNSSKINNYINYYNLRDNSNLEQNFYKKIGKRVKNKSNLNNKIKKIIYINRKKEIGKKIKSINNKSLRDYKYKYSPKKYIQPSYFGKGALKMCQIAINNYYNLEKKYFDTYSKKQELRSYSKSFINKTNIPKKISI